MTMMVIPILFLFFQTKDGMDCLFNLAIPVRTALFGIQHSLHFFLQIQLYGWYINDFVTTD